MWENPGVVKEGLTMTGALPHLSQGKYTSAYLPDFILKSNLLKKLGQVLKSNNFGFSYLKYTLTALLTPRLTNPCSMVLPSELET
jgi:hypothetical protein